MYCLQSEPIKQNDGSIPEPDLTYRCKGTPRAALADNTMAKYMSALHEARDIKANFKKIELRNNVLSTKCIQKISLSSADTKRSLCINFIETIIVLFQHGFVYFLGISHVKSTHCHSGIKMRVPRNASFVLKSENVNKSRTGAKLFTMPR